MLTFRVLSILLSYPTPELKAQLSEAERILRCEGLLGPQQLDGVCTFLHYLRDSSQFEAESTHLDAFDRGRSTSLYLFEHIHGDSRARGQAMVDLLAIPSNRADVDMSRLAPYTIPQSGVEYMNLNDETYTGTEKVQEMRDDVNKWYTPPQ